MEKSTESIQNRPSLRYAAVSLVLAKITAGISTRLAVSETIDILKNTQVNISRSALYRWLKRYRQRGWKGLDQPDLRRKESVLPVVFIDFMSSVKVKDPRASIPEVIRLARRQGIIGKEQAMSRTTVYRYARRMNLPMTRQRKSPDSSKRPYAYPHRLQMVLCDGKHFRAGSERLKRVVFTFLDDSSRFILGVIVGASENSSLFLRGLFDVIATHGLMDHLYLDKGSGFKNADVERVSQQLDIPVIFGATRYPQGHGKIERYNRTLGSQCLRGLAKPGVDPHLNSLRMRIHHYANEQYNRTLHETLGVSPYEKFMSDVKPLRFAQDLESLKKSFTIMETRKVREDNVVGYNDTLYEVPLGYAGTRIPVFFNTVTSDLTMNHLDAVIRLMPPDLASNARERRIKTANHQAEIEPTITTAAEVKFNQDTRPIVDSHGGYTEPYKENKYD